jgi:hypothetical protein
LRLPELQTAAGDNPCIGKAKPNLRRRAPLLSVPKLPISPPARWRCASGSFNRWKPSPPTACHQLRGCRCPLPRARLGVLPVAARQRQPLAAGRPVDCEAQSGFAALPRWYLRSFSSLLTRTPSPGGNPSRSSPLLWGSVVSRQDLSSPGGGGRVRRARPTSGRQHTVKAKRETEPLAETRWPNRHEVAGEATGDEGRHSASEKRFAGNVLLLFIHSSSSDQDRFRPTNGSTRPTGLRRRPCVWRPCVWRPCVWRPCVWRSCSAATGLKSCG